MEGEFTGGNLAPTTQHTGHYRITELEKLCCGRRAIGDAYLIIPVPRVWREAAKDKEMRRGGNVYNIPHIMLEMNPSSAEK